MTNSSLMSTRDVGFYSTTIQIPCSTHFPYCTLSFQRLLTDFFSPEYGSRHFSVAFLPYCLRHLSYPSNLSTSYALHIHCPEETLLNLTPPPSTNYKTEWTLDETHIRRIGCEDLIYRLCKQEMVFAMREAPIAAEGKVDDYTKRFLEGMRKMGGGMAREWNGQL